MAKAPLVARGFMHVEIRCSYLWGRSNPANKKIPAKAGTFLCSWSGARSRDLTIFSRALYKFGQSGSITIPCIYWGIEGLVITCPGKR